MKQTNGSHFSKSLCVYKLYCFVNICYPSKRIFIPFRNLGQLNSRGLSVCLDNPFAHPQTRCSVWLFFFLFQLKFLCSKMDSLAVFTPVLMKAKWDLQLLLTLLQMTALIVMAGKKTKWLMRTKNNLLSFNKVVIRPHHLIHNH